MRLWIAPSFRSRRAVQKGGLHLSVAYDLTPQVITPRAGVRGRLAPDRIPLARLLFKGLCSGGPPIKLISRDHGEQVSVLQFPWTVHCANTALVDVDTVKGDQYPYEWKCMGGPPLRKWCIQARGRTPPEFFSNRFRPSYTLFI